MIAKKTCSKGHIYDSAIYGDNCPFCPSMAEIDTVVNNSRGSTVDDGAFYGDARDSYVFDERWLVGVRRDDKAAMREAYNMAVKYGCRIGKITTNRKLVGLLVTSNISPGDVFNIYEGENTVGCNATSDIYI
ncbi:MAG: hypothetical protein LBT83_00020 [Tannerella sp.]|jgi:hypothetical protein|nr:hypothetical protein [Tannerella sp.]